MDFQENDLLTVDEIKQMLDLDNSPSKQAQLLSSKVKNYFFIKNQSLYVLQPNITYKT